MADIFSTDNNKENYMNDEVNNNEANEGRKLFPEPFYRAKSVAQKLDMGVSTIFKYTSLGLFPKAYAVVYTTKCLQR